MKVSLNTNKNQNPYFGIITITPEAQKMVQLDKILPLQIQHSTNPIQVFIDRSYDLVLKSKKRIIGEDDYAVHFWQERLYKNLLTAKFNHNDEEVVMRENPIMKLLFGHKHFINKVFKRTQKAFYTNSRLK